MNEWQISYWGREHERKIFPEKVAESDLEHNKFELSMGHPNFSRVGAWLLVSRANTCA